MTGELHPTSLLCPSNLGRVAPWVAPLGIFRTRVNCTPLFTCQSNDCLQLAHFLLPNKSTKTYKDMFVLPRECCEKLELQFEPKNIVADFEIGIRSAIKIIWPTSNIRGCRLNASQSCWRKIQELGLSKEYKDKNSDVGKWLC